MNEDVVGAVKQIVGELAVFAVPYDLADMTDDLHIGLAYWAVSEVVQKRLHREDTIPFGAPFDMEWTVARNQKTIEQMVIRHECDSCSEAVMEAQGMLESNKVGAVIICQFRQMYLRPEDAEDIKEGSMRGKAFVGGRHSFVEEVR